MPASFQALTVHHFSYNRRCIVGDSEIVVKEGVREKENEKELCCFRSRFSGLRSWYWKGSVE
jgi:hypothetical protein